ncbi:uncharacterized protein LOC131602076 [Vicia villosa]|uniref:uncharacterized protein LOC131602076 n=1 Tax=Vicia villosa TaxID=3911 RepID=UPI00273BFEC2|nr:uncharacterized protein LOC131602076 [Vicia villosa]
MKFGRTDLFSILQDVKRQGKRIKLKRRWLLGLPITKRERKKLRENRNRYLPELLRKDDMFYESVRTHVERAFGAHYIERENSIPQDDKDLNRIPNLNRLILSCLDSLTTKGLYRLAMIVSGDTAKCERTRGSLKKIIKSSLSSDLRRERLETRRELFQLLNNPQHFRQRCELLPGSESQFYHAAAVKVLCGLEKLPSQTLIAMRRKLKGIKAPMPQLQPSKHGWGRGHLIKLVDKICREMLLKLDEGNELQKPLAKAMSVADLSLKLMFGFGSMFLEELYQFSPEVKSLQSDILNAIWSVEKKEVVSLKVLRDLQLLIEPNATITNKSLRTAFVNLLTEFLFECSDMDSTPKSLLQILDVINKCSNKSTDDVTVQKKHIEEEVDCILSVSAQTNQIIQDLLPDCDFDQDFTDAYMEQSEESDDSESDCDSDKDDDDDDNQHFDNRQFKNGSFSTADSDFKGESVGDCMPSEIHPSTTKTEERLNIDSENLQPMDCDAKNLESEIRNTNYVNQCQEGSTEQFCTPMARDSSVVSPDKESGENIGKRHEFHESYTKVDPRDTSNFCEEMEPPATKHIARKNQYLASQDACDKTAMLAYNLIGHLFEEFAIAEGLNLDLSKRSYLSCDKQIEEAKETNERSSSKKRTRGPAIVQVIEELIPSFPDSSMERLKILMDL